MHERLRQRLNKNLSELKYAINLYESVDQFLRDGDITNADVDRVRNEVSDADKNSKLLQILQTKEDAVFDKLLTWLRRADRKDLVDLLAESDDVSAIEENYQKINDIVAAVLKEQYEETSNVFVELKEVVEVLYKEIRQRAEYMEPEHTEKILKKRLRDHFPHANIVTFRKSEDRVHEVIENLRLKELPSNSQPQREHNNRDSSETDSGNPDTRDRSLFTSMDVDALLSWLEPVAKANKVPTDILSKFRSEEINGKAFENMTVTELQALVPDIKWGNCKNVIVDRDTAIINSKSKSNSTTGTTKFTDQKKHALPPKNECLRSFESNTKLADKYVFEAQIHVLEGRTTDKISPVHKFVELPQRRDQTPMTFLVNEMVKYAAAFMNERTNGTIHFGITGGKVVGVQVDAKQCSISFTEAIKSNFFEDQIEIAMRCIRPPQFIPVLGSKYRNAYVIEVDVVPSSIIIGNEGFFLKTAESSEDSLLYRINEHGKAIKVTGLKLQHYMQEKHGLTAQREDAENKHFGRKRFERNLRRELQDFFCNGGEYMAGDIYPLVFASPSDDDLKEEYLIKNFEFIKSLDARAIFDFEHRQNSNTLASSLTELGEVFMTKMVDEFDDGRNEEKKKQIQKTLEEIRESLHKTWIYCNGFEAGNSPPLDTMEWTKEKTKGFREILNFYKDEIPPYRARVVVLLLSKDFDVISEAIREIALLFQNQWIVLAANESIAIAWKDAMLKFHSTCVNRATLDSNTLVGISWSSVNETVMQFTRIPNKLKTEIPTAKGVFLEIPMQMKNDLCDIQILSHNECECDQMVNIQAAKHSQEVEEEFYRGRQVTWWNFYYQGQVLVRKDHRVFLNLVHDELNGGISYGEKIAKAVIYHHPGSGGTTSAHQVLWDLRKEYPCCTVNRVTDQTAEQIQRLRCFANDDFPKPPVVLLDNESDENVERLTDDLFKLAKNDSCEVFCMLLLCSRQIQLPFEKCPIRMTLKHELTREDSIWFENKNRQLHDSFNEKSGMDPKYLIAFNIMKSNFNKDAIKRSVKEFVDAVPDREREFLLYLSFINAFDLGYQPLPVSCFDAIMCSREHRKILGKRWEQRLEQSTRVLLNRSERPGQMGGKIVTFRIISQLLSKEILGYLMKLWSFDLAQTARAFFNSALFQSKNAINRVLFKCAASLLKRRRWVIKTQNGQEKPSQELLSPLLQEIYDAKNESGAVKVVELGFKVLEDPMVAQQAARLHIELKDMRRAEDFISQAIDMAPNNAYLYHTYGTLCREELNLVHQDGITKNPKKRLSLTDTQKAIVFARKAIDKYQHVEDITKQGSRGSCIDPFGLIGILETVIYLLDILVTSECFESVEALHRFLVQADSISGNTSMLSGENLSFLRNLQNSVDNTMHILETDLSTLKHERRTERKSIMSFESSGSLEKIKVNLNNYFGENRDEVPESFTDYEKAIFRRSRVKTLDCMSLVGIIKQKWKNLHSISQALKHVRGNIDSESSNSFDLLVAISCTLKLECNDYGRNGSGIPFNLCQIWSRKYFEKASVMHPCVEASLFVVLLSWPHSVVQEDHPVNHDMLLSAMNNMLELSTSRTERRRQMPLFYLGVGDKYNRVVLPYKLKLYDKAKSKNPFRSKLALEKLRRFEGILKSSGRQVSVNFQSSHNPGALTIDLPLDARVSNRTMWNKKVYFVVGLGMSGIFIYDVTIDPPDVLKKQAFDISSRPHDPEQIHVSSIQAITHQTAEPLRLQEVINNLLKRVWDLNEKLNRCRISQQKLKLQDEITRLSQDIDRYIRLRLADVDMSRNIY